MDKHIQQLERYNLKESEWSVQPLENARHDFVNDLMQRYLLDLRERINLGKEEKPTFANLIRKQVRVTDLSDFIEVIHHSIIGIREELAEKEAALVLKKKNEL